MIMTRWHRSRMRGIRPSGVLRTGFILPFAISAGGLSGSPLVYDGQGDVIDGGIYLTENDWIDQGGNIWTTAASTFPPDSTNYVPGWYKYDTTTLDGDSPFTIRDELLAGTYLDGLDMSGKEVVKQFSFVDTVVTAQGQAAWLSATDNISVYSVGNPYTHYGTMVVAGISFGISSTASHLRLKNYSFINCGRDALRSTGGSNIEVDGFKCAYVGGSMSSITGARAGDVITFNGGEIALVSDIRVTNSHVIQAFDIAISMQLFSSTIEQTANNIEFDNNTVGYSCAGVSHACHAGGGFAHAITNAITRDNLVTDCGYGWGTYQTFVKPCDYGSYNRGNHYTI